MDLLYSLAHFWYDTSGWLVGTMRTWPMSGSPGGPGGKGGVSEDRWPFAALQANNPSAKVTKKALRYKCIIIPLIATLILSTNKMKSVCFKNLEVTFGPWGESQH
jgi:hypothetical protein